MIRVGAESHVLKVTEAMPSGSFALKVVDDTPSKIFIGGLPCDWTEEQVICASQDARDLRLLGQTRFGKPEWQSLKAAGQ